MLVVTRCKVARSVERYLGQLGPPLMPKEHGAWAVLYGSFVAGAGVAGRVVFPLALLLVGVSALALASGALSLLSRPRARERAVDRRGRVRTWLLLYVLTAAATLGPLLLVWRLQFLCAFGAAAAALLLLRALLVSRRYERTLPGELVGVAGLTLIGPVAHAVAVGAVRGAGLALWPVLFLFFASGIFYVRMQIHGTAARRRGDWAASRPPRLACALYHLALIALVPLLAALHVIPWLLLVAFIPAVCRAAWALSSPRVRLDVRRLGWSETALTVAFVLLLIGGYWLPAIL